MHTVPLGAQTALGDAGPVLVEFTTRGAFRVSHPAAPGWVTTARTPHQLAAAVRQAKTEAQIAAYAQRHGQPYDVAAHDIAAVQLATDGEQLPVDDEQREATITTLVSMARTGPSAGGESARRADPMSWTPLPDGRWRSPKGLLFGPKTQVVQRVIALRADMGIDTRPTGT